MNVFVKKQQGYAILGTAILILIAATFAVFFSVETTKTEERVSSNDYQIRTAFEAAEAGIEFGISYLKANQTTIVADANHDGFIDAYSNNAITNVSLQNGSLYTITYNNPIANNFKLVEVKSVGKSSDGITTRTVTQLLALHSFLAKAPPAGIVAKNSVSLGGNININNSETGTSIWSGSTVTLGGSATTTGQSGTSSDKNHLSSDVVTNDTNLNAMTGDNFFQAFFGTTKADAKLYADINYTNTGNMDYSSLLNNVSGQTIWINQGEGDVSLNGNVTIGSPAAPVILIIDGNFTINGSATIYGIVYIMNSANTWNNNGGGSASIIGSVMVEGSAQSTGTPDITYNNNVLTNAQKLGAYAKVPGTWRDF